MGVGLQGRFYPGLVERVDVAPCLRCWDLIVDVPLSAIAKVGEQSMEFLFCAECAPRTGILAAA